MSVSLCVVQKLAGGGGGESGYAALQRTMSEERLALFVESGRCVSIEKSFPLPPAVPSSPPHSDLSLPIQVHYNLVFSIQVFDPPSRM